MPFERLLTRDLIHVPGSTVYLLTEYRLDPTDTGTLFTMSCARPTGPKLGRAVFPTVLPHLMKAVEGAVVAFKETVEADAVVPVGV